MIREMADALALELVEKGLATDQLTLTVGYDIDNLRDQKIKYGGSVTTDRYGRKVPKHAHGTVNLPQKTSSTREIMEAVSGLYDRIVDPKLLVRRITVVAAKVIDEADIPKQECIQMSLFEDYEAQEVKQRNMQEALLKIKKKYGKNAVLRGMNFEEGATAKDRNRQIGGHRA